MAPRGARSKERSCRICRDTIKLSKFNTYLQCPCCIETVHTGCARDSREIASNGFYYCENHRQQAPKNPKRTQHQQSVRFSENIERFPQTSGTRFSGTNASIEFTPDEAALLNFTNPMSRPDPISTTMPPKTISQQANSANNIQFGRSSYNETRRTANAPNTIYPHYDAICKKCRSSNIFGKFFQCQKCRDYYHNECVSGVDRLGELNNAWICVNCITASYYHKANDLFTQRNSDILAELDKIHFDESLSQSTAPNVNQTEKNATFVQHKNSHQNVQQETSHQNVQLETSHQNVPVSQNSATELMNQLLQTLKTMQLQETMSGGRGNSMSNQAPSAQSTPSAQPNSRNTENINANLFNDNAQTYGSHQIPVNLENYIQETIRNTQFRNEYNSLKDCNQMMAQVQIHESRKNATRILPKVKLLGYEWKIFYSTFLSTKHLFSPVENVIRVSEAIECSEIKRLGGVNLLTPDTLEDTLIEINKRVGKPRTLLTNEKLKLVDSPKLKNGDTQEIIIFIENVKKYSSLIEKVGNQADKSDSALIARIFQILPEKLQSSWLPKYSQLEREEGCVFVSDMSQWLDRQIENYENALSFQKLNPYGELKRRDQKDSHQKDSHPKDDKEYKKKGRQTNLLFHIKEDDSSENGDRVLVTQENNNNNSNYCWFHKSAHHSSLNCAALLKKTGKEVSEMATVQNICTICNQNHNKSSCPVKSKHFLCIIPGCGERHSFLFCDKRNTIQKELFQARGRDQRRKKNFQNNKSNNQKDNKPADHQQHTTKEVDRQEAIHTSSNLGPSAPRQSKTFNFLSGLGDSQQSNSGNGCFTIKEIEFDQFLADQRNKSHISMMQTANEKLTSTNLLPVVVIKLTHKENSAWGAFLLDTGSTISLIDSKVADSLELTGPKKPLAITWSGGQTRGDKDSRVVKTSVQGIHKRAKNHKLLFRTMENLNMPKQLFDEKEMKMHHSHLMKLELASYQGIIGIIGTDQKWVFRQLSWIEGKSSDAPIAFLTSLGFAVMGNMCPLGSMYDHLVQTEKSMLHVKNSDTFAMSETEEEELIKMQQSAMGIEYLMPFENDRKIADDEKALEILKNKVSRVDNSNKYQAPLLWREDNVILPTQESYRLSMQRLHILIKHASRIGKLNELNEQIENLLSKGYAREINKDEIDHPPPNAFYIPIFITSQKAKRLRLIWDAAAKINGKSLNDFLLPGPNLYTDLQSLLLKMREGKYLIKADISEMFHQVKIVKEDRPALRFLFKSSPSGPIKHYESEVMIFGSVSSPCTSQFVKNKIAEEYKHINTDAAIAIQTRTYVDDLVVSCDDLEYGQNLIRDARKILKLGGFDLVKLQGNHPEILREVEKEFTSDDIANPKVISKECQEKILGYQIDFHADTLSICLSFEKISEDVISGNSIPTKTEVLKVLMSIFDPIGFLAFYTSKLKLIYHWTCKEKLGWNDYITEQQIPYWKKCLSWIKELANIKIPRRLFTDDQAYKNQLIIFGDAGKEMLCSVAYIRTVDSQNSQVNISFLMAKTYTVPLKQRRTIPELELDVAAKNVALKKIIVNGHSIKFDEVFYATDNACVYHWIKNAPHKPSLYVRNRYNKITSGSSKDEWIWLPTNLMVADFGTKFDSMPELNYNNEWFRPKVFLLPGEDWLNSAPPIEQVQEQLNVHYEFQPESIKDLHSAGIFNLNRYSSWKSHIRIAIKINSFLKGMQKALEHSKHSVSTNLKNSMKKFIQNDDIYAAELLIIRGAQQNIFSKEIEYLSKVKTLPSKFKLRRFLPFVDSKGILRIKTRLPYDTDMPYDRICPIVLPKNHKITELIIMHYHVNNHHRDYKTIISMLLQRFFIENIHWTVKRIIRENCFKCKKRNAKPDQPQMGDLPSYRLATYTPPFSYLIMDVCGHFFVRVKRGTEKRWILAFSCLTTRALHLEILHSMTAEACLMALQNLINLRGAPVRIISDNGGNFVGASNILKEMQREWNLKLYEKNIICHSIEWEFNPAKSSHMSGSVERMIGLVKSTLRDFYNILEKRIIVPDDAIFRCIVCEIIGLLNNRPLTMIPLESGSNEFLTPNHFLMLRGNFQCTTPESEAYLSGVIKQWVEIKALINKLWENFHKSYVNEILHREKWIDYTKPLKVGDVVILADPTIANMWRMGVVIEIQEGSNDQVRKIRVRLGKNNPPNIKSSKRDLLKEYKNEKFIEVTRPACAVAPLNLCVMN